MDRLDQEFCIICLGAYPLTENNPLTKEHIVPEFIGGGITFRRVCKTCNSNFGAGFEGRLTNQWLFMSFVYVEGIRGKSPAKYPFRGEYVYPESGDRFRLDDDGNVKNHPKIMVIENENGVCKLHFKIDRSDLPKAELMINAKLTRFFAEKGKTLSDEVLRKAYEALHESSNQTVISTVPLLDKQLVVDFNDIRLLHLKIGFELAIYHFGDHLLEDNQVDKIRKVLFSEISSSQVDMFSADNVDIFERITDGKHHWVVFYDKHCYVKVAAVPNMAYVFQLTERKFDFGKNEFIMVFKFDYKSKTVEKLDSLDLSKRMQKHTRDD